MKAVKTCSIPECDARHQAKSYCRQHYHAFKKYGDPMIRRISSTQFTSDSVKLLWQDPDYRSKRASRQPVGSAHHSYKGAKKKWICAQCGSCFESYPNSSGVARRYCSISCAAKSPTRSEKLRRANLGKKATPETRVKLSLVHIGLQSGANSGSWKGGISKIGQQLRSSLAYARWREQVFERDDYTCQLCGERGGKLTADHYPYPFSKYPDKRLDVNNGRTLCRPCHHHVTYVTKEWRYA